MTGFALVADDGLDHLVIRDHDLGGCERTPVLRIPRAVAVAIDDRGVAVPADRASSCTGTPGVVVHPPGDGPGALVEVRADVADPTTVLATAIVAAGSAAACVGPDPERIPWISPPEA